MCEWTQVGLSTKSKKISKIFLFWPNFCHGAQMHTVTKKIFIAKFFVYKEN